MLKNKKTIFSFIALFLALSVITTNIAIPSVDAATTYYYTYIYCESSAVARGIGVGQNVLLVAWTAEIPPDQGEAAGVVSSPSGRAGWSGMQINLTKPDNTSEIINMPYSDPVGANYVSYTPTMVGTYKIQAIFPYTEKKIQVSSFIGGMTVTAGDVRIYTAAVSPIATFEVQQEPVPSWTNSPLPNDYWTRPVSSAARDWFVLTSDWLGGAANVWPIGSSGGNVGSYGYGQAPESAHILWSKPFFIGGVMDERLGDINYQTSHYQGVTFSPAVILDGKIHWSPRFTTHGNRGWEVIDLYSGETLYHNDTGTAPNMGQIYLYESPNQHGGFAYLWKTSANSLVPETVVVPQVFQAANLSVIKTGTSLTVNRTATTMNLGTTVWQMIDAYTFNPICYIANVSSSGTQVYGKDGSILYYNPVNKGTTASPNYYMTVWNSSAGTMVADQAGTGYWQWRPAGGHFGADNPYIGPTTFGTAFSMDYNVMHNGAVFYSQNFSIPSLIRPTNSLLNETDSVRAIRQDNYVIVGTQGRNDERGIVQGHMMAISIAPNSSRGQKLWETTFTPPATSLVRNITAAAAFSGGFTLNGVYPEDGVFTFQDVKQLKTWIFDLYTGEELWETTPQPQFSYYGMSQLVYQHQLIVYGSYAGTFLSYDIKTGDPLWRYDAKNIGEESPYGNYPMIIGAVADGKIYTYTSEHSFTHPLYRGPNLRCINATDGKEIWSILDFGGGLGIADGRLVSSNSMDNEIYCYGRGPSATTISAPQIIPALGTSVMLTGTVTDQTPTGRRNTNDKVDFTLKGTPAISDEDMSAWMEYKFMQQIYPENMKGVPVTVDAIDPNGNFQNIGTTTSDAEGNYAIPFTPEVSGTYHITATFAGSNSYGASHGTAYLAIANEIAPTTNPTTAPLQSASDMYFIPAVIAIIVAIAIVGAILLIAIRKRP